MTPPSKAAARAEVRRRLLSLPPSARSEASSRICGHLAAWIEATGIRVLAAFHPMPSEPDLRLLFPGWAEQTMTVLMPVLQEGGWSWHEVDLTGGWRAGPRGTSAPVRSSPTDPRLAPAILVPGMAFDPSGTRLGRGGGVYDRLLTGLPGLKIGLAFHVQIMEGPLPREPHDIPMDRLLTDHGWLDPAVPSPSRPDLAPRPRL